jgi:hypothetical protein
MNPCNILIGKPTGWKSLGDLRKTQKSNKIYVKKKQLQG